MTDKEIKTKIVYSEDPGSLPPEEKYKYDAYSALWNEIISVFINDEEIMPINPQNQ